MGRANVAAAPAAAAAVSYLQLAAAAAAPAVAAAVISYLQQQQQQQGWQPTANCQGTGYLPVGITKWAQPNRYENAITNFASVEEVGAAVMRGSCLHMTSTAACFCTVAKSCALVRPLRYLIMCPCALNGFRIKSPLLLVHDGDGRFENVW